MKKASNGKFNHKLFYVAAIVLFIASTISAISGKPSGTTLGLGALFLALGVIYSEQSKKENKDNK